MAHLNDLKGQHIGYWEVLYRNGSTKNKAAIWRCKCTLCGSERDVVGSSITTGKSTKCRACVPRTSLSKPGRTSRLYHIYTAMKQRCYNPSSKYYRMYGGKGITICDAWKESFDTFSEWAYSHGYNDSLTIDRINSNGNYEPSNCRWTTYKEQARNRNSCHFVNFQGTVMQLGNACDYANINAASVRQYFYTHKHQGVSIQDAFNHFLRS